MVGGRCLAIAVLLLALSAVAQAELITVRVSEDESVVSDVGTGDGTGGSGYPTVNPHFNYSVDGSGTVVYFDPQKKGVLWTGVYKKPTAYLRTRFYLKFNLPTIESGKYIASATLMGYYLEDLYELGLSHEMHYVANDAWSEKPEGDDPSNLDQGDPSKGITWNNQPLLSPTSVTRLNTFNLAGETPDDETSDWWEPWVAWDITSQVLSEYSGDGVLSLTFKAEDESFSDDNLGYEKFQERERDYSERFVIHLDIVPEPSVFVGLLTIGATGGLVFGYRRWRHLPAK